MESRSSNCLHRAKRWAALLLCAAFLGAVGGAAWAAEGDPPDNVFETLSREVVTPHVNWNRPSSAGTLHALVIAPAWGQRETVELMQRFDLDAEPLMTVTHDIFAAPLEGVQYMLPSQVVKRFDEKLVRSWDVIVIGGFDWGKLLIEHRYAILKKVHDDGVGLVYVQPPEKNEELDALFAKGVEDAPAAILDGIPWNALPAFAQRDPKSLVKTGRFGKGRWVALKYGTTSWNQSLTPAKPDDSSEWDYEYHMSLLGKTLVWAAGKEPSLAVSIEVPDTVPFADTPLALSCTVKGGVAPEGAEIELRIHDLRCNSIRTLPAQTLTNGRTAFFVQDLANGPYILTALLKTNGRYAAWASKALRMESALRIATLTLKNEVLKTDEPVLGKATLTTALPKGAALTVCVWDNHERLLSETKTVDGAFSLPGIRPLGTSLHRVEAFLTDAAGKTVDRAECEFSVSGRARPAFHHGIWEESERDYISGLWFKRFNDLSCDAPYFGLGRGDRAISARRVVRANLFGAPQFPAFSTDVSQTDLGPVHKNSLFDPAFLKGLRDTAVTDAAIWSRWDVLYYGDGSDMNMHGCSFDAFTLEALRIRLQKKYKTVDALNRAWKTGFSAWDSVVPDTLENARKRQVFASWLEHQHFMEDGYIENYWSKEIEAIRSLDSEALCGPEGFGRLNADEGADWWRIMKVCGHYTLYTYQDPPQLEITRSLAPYFPNMKLRSIFYGSYAGQFGNDRVLRSMPWYALWHGYNGLYWYMANGKTTWPCVGGLLAGPDFRPTHSYLVAKRGLDEIRGGLIHLIERAQRQHSGIAFYYDHDATLAADALGHSSDLVQSYQAFQDLTEDLGLQYDYVAAAQIEAGLLKKGGYRILVLPHILAMSGRTAKAVGAFVRDGGILIANTKPATHDIVLNPAADGSMIAAILGSVGSWHVVGSGKTYILDDPMTAYSGKRDRPEGDAMRAKVLALLADAPLDRPAVFRPVAASGTGVPQIEIVGYAQGDAQYVGVINYADKTQTGTLSWAKARHAYDVRARRYLGAVAECPVDLQPGDCLFLALLPEAADEVTVSVERNGKEGTAYTIRRARGCPEAAAFAVRVLDPAGKERTEYGQTLAANADGAARGVLAFALNDARGEWMIEATDVVSGKRARVSVKR